MLRNIAAVIAGNLTWTALWLGLNAVLKMQALLPADADKPVDRAPALLLLLAGSVVFSFVAGYLAATIGEGSYWPAVILAGIQLALGIFFQSQAWRLMPLWYHAVFLLLLVPATIAGAWLKLN